MNPGRRCIAVLCCLMLAAVAASAQDIGPAEQVYKNITDALIVVGTPAANTPERLYFDVRNGLLLRKLTYLETASGHSPYQQDFDEYPDTGSGVKIPFVIRMSPAGPRTELKSTSTLRVTSVKDNVPLADALFSRPAPAARPSSR